MFGVLLEKRPVLVVDSAPSHAGITTSVAARVVEEQCVHTQCFSVIHCCNDVEEWQPKMAAPSPESIDSALEWLRLRSSTSAVGGAGHHPTHPHTLSVLAALNKAMSYAEADSIYLVTHDNRCMEIHTELVAMAKKLPIPLHVVAIDCKASDTLSTLKELAGVTQGRRGGAPKELVGVTQGRRVGAPNMCPPLLALMSKCVYCVCTLTDATPTSHSWARAPPSPERTWCCCQRSWTRPRRPLLRCRPSDWR